MNLLLENPLPIWAAGAVLTSLCLVLVLARRTLSAVLALAGVVALTLLLVFAERVIITDREQVETSLGKLTEALEANDLAAVQGLIDPQAIPVHSDSQALMPQVDIKDAGATAIQIEITKATEPLQATSKFRGRIDGVHTRTGSRLFYFDQVEIDWQKTSDQWLITNYRVYQRGQPIDAVNSVRRNRPVR